MSNERLYGLDTGFKSYFLGINSRGHLTLRINRSEIDLYEVITRHGLSSGYIRIYPTIRYVMSVIHKAFREALVKHGYRGKVYYTYPLKTNSIDRVLDKINNYGKEYSWGFNTGTLEELLIAKKYIDNPRILVVDGVKNREIIKLAREFAEKGWRVYIDIESRREAELLRDTGLNLGLRIKLLTPSTGAWHNATGLDSKFGLNISQVIELLENYPWLRRQIKLLHVHPGSQIDDIEVLVKVFHEAANLYRELRETYELESLEAIDLGGGLAYPYDPLKPNYTIKEYVDKLVEALKNACIRENCPSIIFENGRIIVAFHRIVFSKILDVRPYTIHCRGNIGFPIIDKIRSATTLQELGMITREAVEILTRLRRGSTYESLEQRRMFEELDACIKSLISTKLYEIVSTGNTLEGVLTDLTRYPNYLLEYATIPSYRFLLDYSIFRDLPDYLIVDQYFQVVPLSRLDEPPEVLAVLADLTCDSMGEYNVYYTPPLDKPLFTSIDKRLIGLPGKVLRLNGVPLHLPRNGEEYYVAFLDTGAYQDMLAMNHNRISRRVEVVIDYCNNRVCISVEKPYTIPVYQ